MPKKANPAPWLAVKLTHLLGDPDDFVTTKQTEKGPWFLFLLYPGKNKT